MYDEKCKICGSYAVNPHLYDREEGRDLDLCDVHYWKTRAEKLFLALNLCLNTGQEVMSALEPEELTKRKQS